VSRPLNSAIVASAEPEPPARRAWGASRAAMLGLAVVLFSVATILTPLAVGTTSGVGRFDITPAQAISVLSLVWPRRQQWVAADTRRLGVTSALLILWHVLLTAAIGGPPAKALHDAVVFVSLAWAFLVVYRRGTPDLEWFPVSGRQVRDLMLLGAAHTTALGLLGGGAMIELGGADDLLLNCWWWSVSYVTLVYPLLVNFVLMHPLRRYSRVELVETLPIGLIIGPLCLVIPALYPGYPLEWLILVPAVWIGLALPPRAAVLAALSLPTATMVLTVLKVGRDDGFEPSAYNALQALLLVACAGLVLAASARREELARLESAVVAAARAESEHGALADAVLTAMDDGVLLIGAGGVALSNPAARAMLGGVAPMGTPDTDWLQEYAVREQDGTPLSPQTLLRIARPAPDQPVHLTVCSADPDGVERFFTVSARALSGAEEMSLVVISDSTADHMRHRELESFAGDVAHDLKGPLTAVALWMDTADSEAQADIDAGRHALHRARQASLRMAAIIEDCLAYTTTRAGIIRPRDVDLGDVVREVASVYESRGAVVDVAVDETVRADPTLVRRLMGNLIGNAVKYARPGTEPWIRVSVEPHDRPGWSRVLVADRGIGIDDADAETIFDKFARTAQGSATGEGTGLGLALCRSIVRRHRGAIRAYRNSWGGATIEFTLPQGGTLVR